MPLLIKISILCFPNIEDFLLKLNQVTGLTLELEKVDENTYWVLYETNRSMSVFFNREEKRIDITSISIYRTYLLFSAVHLLEEAGGEVINKGVYPKWKGKKWSEKRWWEFSMKV